MSRPLTPEGYTPEQWDGMKRAAEVLDYAKGREHLFRPAVKEIGVEIPEVEQTYRRGVDSTGTSRPFRVPNKTYLIQCGEFVKIGITNDIHQRLRTLEAYNPLPLNVVAVFAGGRMVERSLHLRFKAQRHRDEWFKVEGELAEWIAEGCPL